jgi:hypothetical protein
LIEPLGYGGSKTILDDYLREMRPLFAPRPRTFQRTEQARRVAADAIRSQAVMEDAPSPSGLQLLLEPGGGEARANAS